MGAPRSIGEMAAQGSLLKAGRTPAGFPVRVLTRAGEGIGPPVGRTGPPVGITGPVPTTGPPVGNTGPPGMTGPAP